MLFISIFGQGFCEIVIPNWSKKSRPKMGVNPSATTVIFALQIFQSLQRTGVFRVPRVSTVSFEKDFNSSGFLSDHCDCAQLSIISLPSDILIIVQPLPESRSCISNWYRHILQCNRRCANIFYRCNVIIVRRIVVRIELFIIVYIINILIFRICFCSVASAVSTLLMRLP